MPNLDFLKMTISELAPKIRNKEISPVELTEAALTEADRLQPKLNSPCHEGSTGVRSMESPLV